MQQPPPCAAAFEAVQVWRDAPVALAVVGPQGVLAWNGACARLLREMVGESESVGRRWLVVAVGRLLVNDRTAEVLVCGEQGQCLAVNLSEPMAHADVRVVSLVRTAAAAEGHDSLAATVSTLSHELRTPLTAMKSSLRLVANGDAGPVCADQTRFLGMTLRNIDRLERLVSDLLDVTRAGPGGLAPRRREADLGPLLREVAQMEATAAVAAGLDLDFTGLPEVLWAHVDADQVQQILGNILGNAIKYTPSGGLVRVWVEVPSRLRALGEPDLAGQLATRLGLTLDTFKIVVEDSGPGLSPEDLERVFEPWYRAALSAKRVPGAGLGLTITRSLVEAHGGRIRLASEPGRGTSVWVLLPRDPASELLLHGARRLAVGAAQGKGHRIALLDGRPLRQTLARPLAELVQEFQRGQVGLAVGEPVALMPDVLALVVTTGAAWSAAWQRYGAEIGAVGLPDWEYPFGDGETSDSESMNELTGRFN